MLRIPGLVADPRLEGCLPRRKEILERNKEEERKIREGFIRCTFHHLLVVGESTDRSRKAFSEQVHVTEEMQDRFRF